eukprot:TRINITY_DN1259_c0_g1_i1.p1 TRINITY_DN1259_c0_g1~~TRINITY_DN1259_c0_g1_i1.p1  ORF type:complete len:241 (+),score=50.15 TRINITY_DN1259_c0_g1_i1:53-775(+)
MSHDGYPLKPGADQVPGDVPLGAVSVYQTSPMGTVYQPAPMGAVHQPPPLYQPVQTVYQPAYQPVVVAVDELPYEGPSRFYGAVFMLLSGYVMIWVGLVLMPTNREKAVIAGFVLQCVGLLVVILGSVITCIVMRPLHENDKCRVAMMGATVFGFVMLIPYSAILYTTDYSNSSYGTPSSIDEEARHNIDSLGNILARSLFSIYAIIVLSVAGCVMGCFCCTAMSPSRTTTSVVVTGQSV